MRLEDQEPSRNIEDRRGEGGFGRRGFPGGGGMRIPIGGRGGLGIGGIIFILILMFVFGINPMDMMRQGGDQTTQYQAPSEQQTGGTGQPTDEMADFVARVLGSTEKTWNEIFQQNGRRYQEPRLVLFSNYIDSACGMAQSAMGPFYCPGDRKVYIDLSFYRDMKNRLGAPGDFAQAYVVAHEVGHHVQYLLGIMDQVTAARQSSSQAGSNALSVRTELQADCFAGIWAKNAENMNQLSDGDIEEGLNAASAIGDDRLQRQSQGRVVPESFTHGSSAQRVRWFKRGYESGDLRACDTFSTDQL